MALVSEPVRARIDDPMIRVDGLRKSYGKVQALRGVTLEVQRGEIVALVGPNGAGKTTLVSILSGLRRPDGGTAIVNNVDVLRHPDRLGTVVGFAPQEIGVYPRLTVRENLRVFARISGLRGRGLARHIDDVAVSLRLGELLDRPAGRLSGGEQRRVHTAIAIVGGPPVLMLDEPTAGADLDTRNALLDVVRRTAALGSSILYSTHYFGEVEQLDGSVTVLDHGRVLVSGSVREVVAEYASAAVELRFAGNAPAVGVGREVYRDGGIVRVEVADADVALAQIIDALPASGARLREAKVVEPGLEAAYTALVRGAEKVVD